MSGFATRLESAMRGRGMGVMELAQRASVSRQTVYNLLRPDFDPLSPGIRKVAGALDVDPVDLLPRASDPTGGAGKVMRLLQAASGRKDARAFELLPAALAALDVAAVETLHPTTDAGIRVLGAAAAMAADLTSSGPLHSLAETLRRQEDPHQALFFGRGLADPVRVVEETPEPLRRHKVFGAFDTGLFRRHLGKV
jgi:transcriptional regulator with XRE-family HTH domain